MNLEYEKEIRMYDDLQLLSIFVTALLLLIAVILLINIPLNNIFGMIIFIVSLIIALISFMSNFYFGYKTKNLLDNYNKYKR